jgi:hypothetical protein
LFNATLNIATSTAGISRFQSKYASGVSLTRITVIGEELSLHRRNATRAHQLMKQVLFTFLASIYVYKRPATCETAYEKRRVISASREKAACFTTPSSRVYCCVSLREATFIY